MSYVLARRLSKADEAVRDLRATGRHKYVVPDTMVPQLLLIVHPSGSKTWAIRTYPRPGIPSSRSIGHWPEMSVAQARRAVLFGGVASRMAAVQL
jgi:hypothetical protein